jgi:hypothetical protein
VDNYDEETEACIVVTSWWPAQCGVSYASEICSRGWGTYESINDCCDEQFPNSNACKTEDDHQVDQEDELESVDADQEDIQNHETSNDDEQNTCVVVTSWWPGECGVTYKSEICGRGWGTFESINDCCDEQFPNSNTCKI